MSKYTREELQTMAKRVLEAKEEGDPRYNQFLFILNAFTLVPIEQCIKNIESMAVGTYED